MLSNEKLAELKVKHLEMIQALVTRMAGYGATFKSLCITVTTAVCGFGITLHRPVAILLAIFPVLAFALLDAQCLRVERRFRLLYEAVRGGPWDVMPDFAINLAVTPAIRRRDVVKSWSIVGFYGPIAFGVVVVALIGRFVLGTV